MALELLSAGIACVFGMSSSRLILTGRFWGSGSRFRIWGLGSGFRV